MSLLAEPLLYDEPPASYLSSTSGSTIVKRLAWYGLAPDTRKGYAAAIDSYESFCALFNKSSWPVTTRVLGEWAANQIFGISTLSKQDQIKSDQYAILRLKQSKTDMEHTGVQIILAAIGEPTCPVVALRRLFIQDPPSPDAHLFRLSASEFSRQTELSKQDLRTPDTQPCLTGHLH